MLLRPFSSLIYFSSLATFSVLHQLPFLKASTVKTWHDAAQRSNVCDQHVQHVVSVFKALSSVAHNKQRPYKSDSCRCVSRTLDTLCSPINVAALLVFFLWQRDAMLSFLFLFQFHPVAPTKESDPKLLGENYLFGLNFQVTFHHYGKLGQELETEILEERCLETHTQTLTLWVSFFVQDHLSRVWC